MRSLIATIALLSAGSVAAFVPTPSRNANVASSRLALNNARDLRGAAASLRMSSESSGGNPFQSLLGGLFQKGAVEAGSEPEKPKIPDCVVKPSYSLAIGFAFYALFFVVALQASILGVILGGLNLLFASFLAVQTSRIRFVFDETAFELKTAEGLGPSKTLADTGENIVVGGANRWGYDKFVNWDFFPSKDIPILVYFKETQTPPEKWGEGPGQLDKKGGGQVHFFPAICDCRELEEQFKIRDCAKVED